MALTTGTAMAQQSETKEIFKPHWTLGIQAGVSETRGEVKFSDLLSPAVAGYVGYRFTPVVGVRVGASAFEAKGSWVSPHQVYKYNYVQGNADVVFDLSALVAHYNVRRVFNLYAFVGAGVNGAFKNDEAGELVTANYPLTYYWSGHRISPVGRGGLGVNLRLSKRVAINVEANANVLSDHYNSKKAGNADWQFNLMGGLTFSLGRTSCTSKTVVADEVAATPIAPIEDDYAPVQPSETTTTIPAATEKAEVKKGLTENIFFRINSSVVRTTELGKVEALVHYLKQHLEAKVSITGYADAATGTAAINKRISTLRSKAVANALMKRGIASSRIVVSAKGDTVQPFDKMEDNRVSICIAEWSEACVAWLTKNGRSTLFEKKSWAPTSFLWQFQFHAYNYVVRIL